MPAADAADGSDGDDMTTELDGLLDTADEGEAPRPRYKTLIRTGTLVLWGLVMLFVIANAIGNPSTTNVVTAVGFVALFAIVQVQFFVVRWAGRRHFKRLEGKLRGSGYISELDGLPNRNYLLAELRREMPRARAEGTPFTVVVFELETLDEIRERRGEDFADRALYATVETLRRTTRNSDFLAHLGGTRFCVLLVECGVQDAYTYLRRVPGVVAVSDGRHMLDVPVTARMSQYDMESLYATDVLADAEESQPLQRKVQPRGDSRAA